MFRKLIFNAVPTALIAAVLSFAAPAANAETQTSTTDNTSEVAETSANTEPSTCEDIETSTGTGECGDVIKSESHSKSSASSRAVAVNGVSLTSNVTVLANIRVNGTPAAQQTDCYRTPHDMWLWTSYNAEGTTGWHWKFYPKGYRFCRINGAVRDPKCHNQVKIGVPHSRPPKNAITGKVKFVKRLKWEVKAVAKADEKVSTFAKAWCTTQNAYAYGEGRGMAAALAVGRGSAKGYVLSKLYAQAEAQAAGDLSLQLEGRSVVQVKAHVRATAFAKATSTASAKAVCKDTPEVEKPGSIVEVEDVNDVLYGNTRTWRVRGVIPEGQTATLRVSARIGTVRESDKMIHLAAGPFDIAVQYTAPTEGTSDTLTAALFGSDGVKDDEKSDTFDLRSNPVDPLYTTQA